MNKCIYIISALLSRPELLILDEPFNFLSNESAERLKKFISEYRKKGNTILIAHENYEGVEDVCTKFTALKGREQIRRDETPQKYRKKKLIAALVVFYIPFLYVNIKDIASSIEREERLGTILYFLSQPVSKIWIVTSKLLVSIGIFAAEMAVWQIEKDRDILPEICCFCVPG